MQVMILFPVHALDGRVCPAVHLVTSVLSVLCMYVCFSVCNGAESQILGALLRCRVFYSIHIARRVFSKHGITDIPHQSTDYRTGEADERPE